MINRVLTEMGVWLGLAGRDKPVESDFKVAKFVRAAPSAQNAVDIFRGRWASDLSGVLPSVQAGSVDLFVTDPRPKFLLRNFASDTGDLSAQRILELGPLEGGHCYQFEQLGAEEIVAVEANIEAYLKCLVVKELCALTRTRFLCGDCVEFLRSDARRWDVIFCCGILYHMADPVRLIELMAERTDRIFIWTHYYDESAPANGNSVTVKRDGNSYAYHRRINNTNALGTFWGGNQMTASLMPRDHIMRAFRSQGFINCEIHEDTPAHENGPCFSMSVWR